jgi:hypothetical protein
MPEQCGHHTLVLTELLTECHRALVGVDIVPKVTQIECCISDVNMGWGDASKGINTLKILRLCVMTCRVGPVWYTIGMLQ